MENQSFNLGIGKVIYLESELSDKSNTKALAATAFYKAHDIN